MSSLSQAIRNDDERQALRLLAGGARPDVASGHGRTPLHGAARAGMLDLCHALLDAGANINARTSGGTGDAVGETPLHIALETCEQHPDRERIALALIERGAEVDSVAGMCRLRGWHVTPLDMARLFGARAAARRLEELDAAPASILDLQRFNTSERRFERAGRYVCGEIVSRGAERPAVIECVEADITRLNVHIIVNAANPSLLGGGGVDGAIHAAAGPELADACRELPEKRPGVRCEPGDAVATPGFNLHAVGVFHTVGPVWEDGESGEADVLASCYRHCIELAYEGFEIPGQGFPQIAFPSISTGAYGFPPEEAARIAVKTLREALRKTTAVHLVTLCCYDEEAAEVVQEALGPSRGSS